MKRKIISLSICLSMLIVMISSCTVDNESGVSIDIDSLFSEESSAPAPEESSQIETSAPPETTTVITTTEATTTTVITTTPPPETTTVITTTTFPETPAPVQTEEPDGYQYPHYYDYIMGNHGFVNGNTIYNNNETYFYDIRENAKQYKANTYSVLWYGSNDGEKPKEVYSREGALDFALHHWDDGLDLCAPFISRCLKGGGISPYSNGSTGLCMQLINSGLGFGQFLPINEDRTVTLPDYAERGDVIQVYCPYEGLMIHSLLFNGNDKNGNMMVYCHNFRNNGTTTFYIDELCYDDDVYTNEVFFFHFYDNNENDKKLPQEVINGKEEILIFENEGYCLKEKYNRKAAIEYAKNYMYDGIGMFGALH
ncbi:MAG: hypothetical protein IKT78_05015, partial [Ruminiclostridium sp.]|nr:hypothetical protein [Ruminiclostridium sp.]